MTYAGASNDRAQNIASDPKVQFQTGKVVSSSGMCASYYAGAWQNFTNGMELLPNSYPFRFTGYPQTSYQVTGGSVTSIY